MVTSDITPSALSPFLLFNVAGLTILAILWFTGSQWAPIAIWPGVILQLVVMVVRESRSTDYGFFLRNRKENPETFLFRKPTGILEDAVSN
jgi:hypothetical protein